MEKNLESIYMYKEMTEDKMVGGHHPLNRHVFEQALGDG